MNDLRFFDVNAIIGEPMYSSETGEYACYLGPREVLAEMDRCGIHDALVSHWDAMKTHPSTGNGRLLEVIRGYDRLYPCWLVLPHHSGEFPEPAVLIRDMQDSGVRAVRLMPGLFGFDMTEWSTGALLRELEANRILTIIDAGTADIHSVCTAHPQLPVVATAIPPRGLHSLLSQFGSLRVSTEGARYPGILEDVCAHFGADRVLFGSLHLPPVFPTGAVRYEPGAWALGSGVAMVAQARIDREDKEKIAGGNLRSLLGVEDAADARRTVTAKMPPRIIDSHLHLGPFHFSLSSATGVDDLIRTMDATGVERVCMSATRGVTGGNHYEGNDKVAAACTRHPDRFVGFGVINPHFPDTKKEIKRCIADLGFKGLKIHPRTHQCELSDPKYRPVWEGSEEHRVPILAHTGARQTGANPAAFEAISADHPDGVFLLGHSGDNLEGLRTCLDIAGKRQNVYLGTSDVPFMYLGMLEYAVNTVGASKILFESDWPCFDLNHSLGVVLYSRISQGDKAKILGLNMARILGL